MREILFRGRPLDGHSNWVYGFYFGKGGLHSIIEPSDIYKCEHCGNTARVNNYSPTGVDPNTVGQYTGIKDKNGIKIFEGDVVKFEYWKPSVTVHAKIEYLSDEARFMMNSNESTYYHFSDAHHNSIEVVGNIHDNPELIK